MPLTIGTSSALHAAAIPSTARANDSITSGRSGLPKLRQSVMPMGSAPVADEVAAHLGDRHRGADERDRARTCGRCSRRRRRETSRSSAVVARTGPARPRRRTRGARRCRRGRSGRTAARPTRASRRSASPRDRAARARGRSGSGSRPPRAQSRRASAARAGGRRLGASSVRTPMGMSQTTTGARSDAPEASGS